MAEIVTILLYCRPYSIILYNIILFSGVFNTSRDALECFWKMGYPNIVEKRIENKDKEFLKNSKLRIIRREEFLPLGLSASSTLDNPMRRLIRQELLNSLPEFPAGFWQG